MNVKKDEAVDLVSAKLRAKINLLDALLAHSVRDGEWRVREIEQLQRQIEETDRCRRQELERHAREIEELRRQIEERHAREIEELRRQIEETERRRRQGLEELEALLRSTSWRVTIPLRLVGSWLRPRGRA